MEMMLMTGDLVANSCPTLAAPWTVTCQAPLPMGLSGKNTGVGCHSLLNPGIKPQSPALQADSLPTDLQGKSITEIVNVINKCRYHKWRQPRVPLQGKQALFSSYLMAYGLNFTFIDTRTSIPFWFPYAW